MGIIFGWTSASRQILIWEALLYQAMQAKHDDVIDLLLDIHERDLRVLATTEFGKALVALGEDQTDELLQALKKESTGDVVPVLLKATNLDTPTIAYLSKRKTHQKDRSIEFAHRLEAKDGMSDISNERKFLNGRLGLAIDDKNDSLLNRLLAILRIADENYYRNFELKLKISDGSANELESVEPEVVAGDLSILRSAVESKNFDALLLVVDKMLKSEKFTLEEILRLEHFRKVKNVADANFNLKVLRHFDLAFEDFEDLTRSVYGNILHLFLFKEANNATIRDLITSHSKLVMERDDWGHFPIYSAITFFSSSRNLKDQCEIIELLYDTMVEQSGNADVTNDEDIDDFLDCLALDDVGNLFAMDESAGIALMQKIFNGKFAKILEDHGVEILHKVLNRFWFDPEPRMIAKFLVEQKLVRSETSLSSARAPKKYFLRESKTKSVADEQITAAVDHLNHKDIREC